jgi:hypothetical protein
MIPNVQNLTFSETADVFTMIYHEAETINPILAEKIRAQGDHQYRKTNVQADMTKWTMFEDLDFKKIINFAIEVVESGLDMPNQGKYYATDCWGALYRKGDSCNPHAHHPALWSFTYYVDATPDDAPLVFPTSGNAIFPNSGLMVVFPGWVTHSVPEQKNDQERIVVAGNLTIERLQAN